MNIPIALIAVFTALCLFYYTSQKMKNRREDRRQERRERQEEYLQSLLDAKKDINKSDEDRSTADIHNN